MQRIWKLVSILAVILAVVAVVVSVQSPEESVSRSYSVPVYMEQGGAKLVVGNGGAVEVQAGGALQITPGATVDLIGQGGSFENVVVSAPTAVGTATPAIIVNSAGVSNLGEFRKNGTPQVVIGNTGNYSGQAGSFAGNAIVTAPTAVGTATPALGVVNNGVSDGIVVWDGSTIVMQSLDGGGVRVVAPTAIATAVPGLVVDGRGVSNPVEVRVDGTPQFTVHDAGTVTGKVLRYATAGTQIVCGTDTITDTADVSHGLTTPAYAMCSLNQELAGDAYGCNATVAGATVTVKVKNNAATPTANATGASVNWCVIGTP